MARASGKALVFGSAAVVMAAAIGYFVVAMMDASKPPAPPTVRPAAISTKPVQPALVKPEVQKPSGPNQAG